MPSAAVDGDLQPAAEPCVSTTNPVAEELARKAKAFDVAEKKRIEKLEKRRKRAALLRERKRNAAARKAEQSSSTAVTAVPDRASGESVPTAAAAATVVVPVVSPTVALVRKVQKGVKRTAAVAQMNNSTIHGAKAGAVSTTKSLTKRARTDDDDTTSNGEQLQ